jgi:hypothetical protein
VEKTAVLVVVVAMAAATAMAMATAAKTTMMATMMAMMMAVVEAVAVAPVVMGVMMSAAAHLATCHPGTVQLLCQWHSWWYWQQDDGMGGGGRMGNNATSFAVIGDGGGGNVSTQAAQGQRRSIATWGCGAQWAGLIKQQWQTPPDGRGDHMDGIMSWHDNNYNDNDEDGVWPQGGPPGVGEMRKEVQGKEEGSTSSKEVHCTTA